MSSADKDAKTRAESPAQGLEQSGETRREVAAPEPSASLRDLDFGARYRVVKTIGRGGMGEVYRAYDVELSRDVALKVIRADRTDHELAFERFRREVGLASKVTHENVLRVYDLGEKGDLHFLSMQFVEGQDLSLLMKTEGPLPLPRAMGIFEQICKGLSAAHKQGIVHRDLKPQNVLVDRADHVYVADFGLARSLEDATMTAEGALLGSPAYMSPEQVKGDPLDARSDIYALGVMLYQLLTAEAPFQGASAHSVMEQRLHKKPTPVRERNAEVPAHLERVVQRCLEVDPARRFATVSDLIAALHAPDLAPSRSAPSSSGAAKALGAVAGVVALAAVGLLAARGLGPAAAPAQPAASSASAAAASSADPAPLAKGSRVQVLLLNIENRTSDPVLDGTLDLVLGSALRMSTALSVVSGPDMPNLVSELGAETADEELGKKLLARDGGRVVTVRGAAATKGVGFTLSVEARDASSGAVLASRSMVAADASRIAPALGSLAWTVRAALGERAPSDPSVAEQTGASASLEADHEASVGARLSSIGKGEESVAHLDRATTLDPEFALAQSILAISLWNLGRQTDALQHLKLAVKWGDRLGEYMRRKVAGDYYTLTGEYDRSIAEFDQMVRTWPGDLKATTNLGLNYFMKGDMDQALVFCQRAADEHPRDITARSNVLNLFLFTEDFEQTRKGAEKVVLDFPHPIAATFVYLGVADTLLDRRAEGRDAYAKLGTADSSLAASALADLAFYEGRLVDAAALLTKGIAADEAAKNADPATTKWATLAQLRLRMGDKAGAIAAADKASPSTVPVTMYAAAQVYLEAGQTKKAQALSAHLSESLSADARRFAKLLAAEGLRFAGKPREAVDVYEDILHKTDLWLAHFLLAQTYLDLSAFAEARSELKTCLSHRGEGSIVFLDDIPSLRFLPPAYYAFARAQEGLGVPDAVEGYKAFLALEPEAQHDPLADEARRHVAGH